MLGFRYVNQEKAAHRSVMRERVRISLSCGIYKRKYRKDVIVCGIRTQALPYWK